MVTGLVLDVLFAIGLGTVHLDKGADHAQGDDERRKHAVGHVGGLLGGAAVAALVPALPVLPGSVAGRVVCAVAPGMVVVAHGVVDGGGPAGGPADAVGVVEAALDGVAEQVVGGDDEAVAVDAGGVGDVGEGGAVVVLVRVVELDELVEAPLAVGLAALDLKDLVGGGLGRRGPVRHFFVCRREAPSVRECAW